MIHNFRTMFAAAMLGIGGLASADNNHTAAEFNPVMERMYQGCVMLSNGVADNNEVMVGFAADYLNSEKVIDDTELRLAKLSITPVAVEAELPVKNCFEYNYDFARLWIDTHGKGPFLEDPSNMRAYVTPLPKCLLYQIRLKPHSSAEYDVASRGRCDYFFAYEPGTDVEIALTVPGQEVSVTQVEHETVKTAHWNMSQREKVRIRLTNNSDIPSTVLIASN